MWHVGAESRPQGTGHKDESERELGYAGYGEVPGFHSWQSGEVLMVLSSRMTWADFPCNPPPGCCVETRLGGGGVGGAGKKQGGSEEAAADSLDESGVSPALAALSVPLLVMCTRRPLVGASYVSS